MRGKDWKIGAAAIIFLLNFAIYFCAESSPTTENAIRTDSETFQNENIVTADVPAPWSHETFKVGYVKDTGFVEEDMEDHKIGYGYEYMEFLSNYVNCNFEYVEFVDWDDMAAALTNKTVDIIPGMPGDDRRVQNGVSTEHVVGRFPMELVVKDGVTKPNMKIGIVPMSYPTPGLAGIARGEGFTYEEVSYPKFHQMIAAYENGEIDGYVDAMLDPKKSDNVLSLFDRQSYYLVVHADNPELLRRLDLAMDQMLLVQSSIRDRLTQKYFRKEGFPLILSRAEKEYLAERKKLKAAIFIYQQPYAYYDENNQLAGIMPDLLERIAEDLNIEIELIETKSIKETHDLVQSGGVDFVADAVCDHSWASSANIKPTQSFLTMDYIPVTRKDYDFDFDKEPVIACVKSMLYGKYVIAPQVPAEKILYVDTPEESLQAVNDGRADVSFVYRSSVGSLIDSAGTYALEYSSTSYFSEPVSLGVYAYENPHLWQILNKEINHIDADWMRDTMNKHQLAAVHITPMWVIYHHPVRVIFAITLLAMSIGGFFIYRNRMKQRHFELVQHMAYNDLRYDLPNVPWLEKEVPAACAKLRNSEPLKKTFFAIFAMDSGATVTADTGRKAVDKKFKEMAANLSESAPVILTAAGIDVEHLICFCKADSEEEIISWAEEVIKNYSYMETADAQAKVILHTKAGISSYVPTMYVQQAIDRALTACHNQSNGSVKVFDEQLEELLSTQHMIEGRMEQALRDGEFKAWYQPKYDIRTRRIVGAEALVRWISPETGFMPPGKFIPLFEQNGFVIQVDYYILEKTFQLQKERLKSGKEVIPISVNQSRLHMTEEGYLEKMRAIVEKYNLPPGLIELEVTETMFGDFDARTSQQNAVNIMNGLHELGFTMSVDDFGSGYSSFSMLAKMPMDVMKIDRSLLTGADSSLKMKNVLANVINLGNSLKMKVLCEGIETREEENLLLELGCYFGQGFFNGKPMPVEDFVSFFEKRNAEVEAGTVTIPG